jgi:hypothetical protein
MGVTLFPGTGYEATLPYEMEGFYCSSFFCAQHSIDECFNLTRVLSAAEQGDSELRF